jgi:predicted nucleic acid-binding protein
VNYVLDASVAVMYSLKSEDQAALTGVGKAFAPVSWRLEVASAVHQAVLLRRQSLREAQASLRRIQALPMTLDELPAPTDLFRLQRLYGVSAYDAAYLWVAIERDLRIATFDSRLSKNLARRQLKRHVLPVGALPALA